MRGQPQRGFRRFIATTASMSSWLGPLGPGRRPQGRENSIRYFRFFSTLCRCSKVEGLKAMGGRRERVRRKKKVQKPAKMRTRARKGGARLPAATKKKKWRANKTESANAETEPAGLASRARVTIR